MGPKKLMIYFVQENQEGIIRYSFVVLFIIKIIVIFDI